ncbi:hypothetical protein BDV18DRAFT_160062 [Aspergillus unguis]
MALFSSLAQTQARSVSIEVLPATRNLAESQLVHAALKKYGEVVFFRNKQYKNSTSKRPGLITATFDTPQAAQSAIATGTLQIPLPESQNNNNNTNSIPTPRSTPSQTQTTLPTAEEAHPEGPRTLEVRIQHSQFDHNRLIQRNPFYHPFNPDTTSHVHADLIEKLDVGLRGLADAPGTQKKEKLVLAPRAKAKQTIDLLSLREKYGSLWKLWEDGKRAASRKAVSGDEETTSEETDETERKNRTSELEFLQARMWKTVEQIKANKRKGLPCLELEEELNQLAKHRMALESMNAKAAKNKKEKKKKTGKWGRTARGDDWKDSSV